MGLISENIRRVRTAMEDAARRAGRRPEDIELVAVSKTVAPERIRQAYDAGLRAFGENKVQDFLDKKDRLPADCRWHFIGRLQTNKVKALLESCRSGRLALLHSLDRLDLIREIEKQAPRCGLESLEALLQVNTTGEASKAGFNAEEVPALIRSLAAGSTIRIRGLMTIGPLTEDREKIRAAFRRLRVLSEDLRQKFPEQDWTVLSMGMSGDFCEAIEEGSTLVRVGTALFGPRVY